ncbi:MAG: DoxX family protein [Planctomyces sp.]|nr:DoxX family protein [Planctomyces sp.]
MLNSIISIIGRTSIVAIFLMSALGNKIPNYSKVVGYMASEGVPAPQVLLAGAIAFLIIGGITVLVGYKARVGASLLLIFLALATYYFHDFWTVQDAAKAQAETIQFFKNVSMMGAMLFIIANGSGAGSLDALLARRRAKV